MDEEIKRGEGSSGQGGRDVSSLDTGVKNPVQLALKLLQHQNAPLPLGRIPPMSLQWSHDLWLCSDCFSHIDFCVEREVPFGQRTME